jgi:tetratricopeptide (TPR) repeat protein
MKKIFLLIGLLIAGFALNAQSQDAYVKAMQNGLEAMGKAESVQDLLGAAGQFERISARVKDQWHPHYYAALNYINASFRAEGLATKDSYTEKAQGFIDNALKIAPNESEVVALQGFNYMTQLSADPGGRGQSMSPKAMQTFGKAMGINPENPRAMTFMAQMQFGTAQFFGSSTAASCEAAKKTLPLFDAESKGRSFDPTWGKDMAEAIIEGCTK